MCDVGTAAAAYIVAIAEPASVVGKFGPSGVEGHWFKKRMLCVHICSGCRPSTDRLCSLLL